MKIRKYIASKCYQSYYLSVFWECDRLNLSFFRYVASTQKFSYVPEGASCDEGFFCFQNRCIKPTGIALHSKCPKGPYLAPLQDDVGTDFIHPAVRRSLPAITNSPVNITCAGRGVDLHFYKDSIQLDEFFTITSRFYL